MAARGDIKNQDVEPILFEDWLKLNFDNCLEKAGAFSKIKSSNYFEQGEYPVIDQGEKYVSGFVNDKNLIYKGELPVIIFGDHTRIFKYVTNTFAVGADGTKILKPIKAFDSKFFFYYMKSLTVPSLGYSRHYKILNSIEVPVPPLPEQQRIVAKLDTLFGQLDKVKTHLERIPQLLKDFRQKVLTQAVTGKLTEEWREGRELESMKNYLPFIRNELFDNSKEYGTRFKTNDSPFSEDLPEVPNSWIWTRLINIADVIGGVTKGRKLNGKKIIHAPYLRVANVQDGYLNLSEMKEIEVLPIDLIKYELISGDILFTEGGDRDKLGRGTIWRNEIPGCIHQNHIFRARVSKKYIIPEYISFFTKGAIAKSYFFENANQTVNLASLNLTTLSNVPIALPNREEQLEIVNQIESLFAKADKIEASYQKLKEKIEQLPQAILAKAFRGELVEQLPTDGDARDLLEEIKKLKGGLEKGGRSRKIKEEESIKLVAEPKGRYGK